MKEQSQRLGTQPIPKLLANLSIPAMIGMFVMALYNVVDTLFIARGVGVLGIAGVSIGFPVMMILMAASAALGIGGASVISRRLGENRPEEANQVFGNVLFTIMAVSLLGFVGAFTFIEPLLKLFGATENILPYSKDYLYPIMLGSIFFSFAFTTNNIIRSEGNSRFAMMAMIGVLQGMQPITGYNYGAKHYERLRETISLGLRVVTVISFVIFLVMMIFPESLMKIFTGDPLTVETGAHAMRVMFALAILIGVQVVGGGLYQALGMAKPALILSMARQVLFLIPLVLILPHFFGVTGVWLAFPLSDLLAFTLSALFLYKDRKLLFKSRKQPSDYTIAPSP